MDCKHYCLNGVKQIMRSTLNNIEIFSLNFRTGFKSFVIIFCQILVLFSHSKQGLSYGLQLDVWQCKRVGCKCEDFV